MKKLWFLLAIVATLGFGIASFRGKLGDHHAPAASAAAGMPSKDTCEGKQVCAVAYVAPWCPYCKRIEPGLRTLATKANDAPDYGLRVIVGGGEPAQNQELAATFGAAGVVDANNELARRLNVQGYPSFFFLDEKGKELTLEEDATLWFRKKLTI